MDKKNLPSDDEDLDLEVSLPGVGDNEQPTILEVLNRGIVNTETEDGTGSSGTDKAATKVTSTLEDGLGNPKNDQESDILVSSSATGSQGLQAEWKEEEPQRSQLAEDDENVFDIESHLIETLKNYSVSEDSESWGVDIKELPPAEGESLYRTSKSETDPSIGTVFEVEPATPRVLKPVETSLPEPLKQTGLAHKAQEERRSPAVEVESTNENQEPAAEAVIEQEPAQKTEEVREVKPVKKQSTKSKANKLGKVSLPEDRVESKLEDARKPINGTAEKSEAECVISESVKPVKEEPIETDCVVPESKESAEPVKEKSIKPDFAGPESKKSVEPIKEEFIKPDFVVSDSKESVESIKVDCVVPESKESAEPVKEKSIKAETVPSNDRVSPEEISATQLKEDIESEKKSDSEKEENIRKGQKESTTAEPKVDHVQSSDSVDSGSSQPKILPQPTEAVVLEATSEEKPTTKAETKVDDAQTVSSTESPKEDTQPGNESLTETVELAVEDHKPHDTNANLEDTTNENNKQSKESTNTDKEPTAPDPQPSAGAAIEKSNDDPKTDLSSTEAKTPTTLLTEEINQKLSELTTHLNGSVPKLEGRAEDSNLDVNGLPLPKTAQEEEQRQQFLDSLPQISPETDANKAAALAKREYYQSLRQYLITHSDKPPIPPETYRWEDLRRAKQRGGYPWTHLYKRPLGPDEEPEIVLLLRKSQELRFSSESPKSFKKVRIDDQVSIKETERYIQELSDTEDNPPTEDEDKDDQEDAQSECISCVSDSVLTVEKRASKLGKIRGILKKRGPRKEQDAASLPDTSTSPSRSLPLNHKSEEDIRERPSRPLKESHNKAKCFPIMKKLRSMADRQKKNFQNIKKISLKKDEKISLEEEQKIIKLKTSPKAERSEIPHFIEKQDSDDVLEIVELDESPSRKRKDQLELQEQAEAAAAAAESTVVEPDEIIEIPKIVENDASDRQQTPEPTVSEILEEELKSEALEAPPKKTARLRREHVYEDIESANGDVVSEEINNILEMASVEALKQSLAHQDSSVLKDVEATKPIPLERMGSSEEEVERSHLAPLSSIDSGSSEDERKPHLSTVAEESDGVTSDKEEPERPLATVPEVKETDHIPWNDIELKPALKKEASPSPSEKKVTFSHVEDEAEPHREDIELPEGLAAMGSNRWSNLSDHEYEPIGEPPTEAKPPVELHSALKKETSPAPAPAPESQELPKLEISQPSPEVISDEGYSPTKSDEGGLKEAEELQKDIEDRYFSSAATTPRTESRTDYDHTSQVDSSALEELPLKPESRKKGFMASAQDRTRKMQAGLKNQAGKIKTKFRTPKKIPSGSPKAKDRKRFKAPEFSKIKMPEMKRPDLSGFKRPEFTKFSKPDMSKFKLPDKFSSLKLTRSKSFKEPTEIEDTTVSGTTPESTSAPAAAPAKKQKFDFSFGTYPRAFRKKKKPLEPESTVETPSVIPSTETQPSAESSSTPQGDRGPGPVRSRWADKFSDVSFNDSEGSRYRPYGSEQESSFDRESSMERRMKEVLDESAKEEAELAILAVVEPKQFADYDEENRVIHEISKTREREFKRRPIVHQDSDLISDEGRDIGWTDREAEKNQMLRKAELEAEAHLRYLVERESNPETQSTASSKKFVFEEINADEFLLRNKGLSQEFNIGQHRFLDPHLEAGFDNSPNALAYIGAQSGSLNGSSIDRMDYGYDPPPPKPRRLSHQQRHQRHYDSENASQVDEFADEVSLSQTGSDYLKHAPPARPLRKGRFKHSQEISIGGTSSVQYDDEENASRDRVPREDDEEKENIVKGRRNESPMPPPQAPRRRRKLRDSVEKDSYMNGFGGRSVSNSYLKEDNKPEEVIVYRTEHEYKIPLATPEHYTDTSAATTTTRKSRSLSRLGMEEDDHTSQGVDSINLELAMRGDAENDNANLDEEELQEKYIIEMMENDGYAVVRKENLPKPTPPARRKKFSRSPGERFATMPHLRRGSPAVQDSKSGYSTVGKPTPPRRKSALSLGADSQKDLGIEDFVDYEVPALNDERTDSPRNLQSGDVINKMKYRPLPPPPRPPREKRHTLKDRHGDDEDEFDSRDDRDDRDGGGERAAYDDYHEQSSDDFNLQRNVEVEVSTQTDPLPDDFVCEEFEITEDMKIIEPRRTKTLDEILKDEEEAELERARQIDEEVLLRGIQRFREANQRSLSEKSRASSQAKSLSRPQTPSAILIEKRVPTPVPNANGQTVLEASLTVQPIDDLDLEEELLRRDGLYDGSHSKSDAESRYQDEEEAAHASEEENARIGEEEGSYTRSTDEEIHQEEDEEVKRLEEQRLLTQRLQEEEEEERRIMEEIEREQRLLEEEQREQQRLEDEERERRLQEDREEQQRLKDELAQTLRLRLDSRSEQERLKPAETYDLQSEVSTERESTPPAPSPTPPPPPPPTAEPVAVEEVIPARREKKQLAEPKPLTETPDETPSSPPPMAPPRKRSAGVALSEEQAEELLVAEQKAVAEPATGVAPTHLALADLEVERLRVHALQAGQIMVSHLHGAHIQAEELECQSGNLVVNNIALPPGFIEDIVERVRSTERGHSVAATQTIAEAKTQTEEDSIPPPPIPTRQSDVPPVRPPPPQRESVFPSEYMQPAPSAPYMHLREPDEPPMLQRSVHPTDYLQSVPPIGFYSHRAPDEDAEPTPPVYRRRRHHRRRDSSSEDEHPRRRSRSARPETQSVAQAGRQFISACSLPLTNVINQLTNVVRQNNDNKQDQVQPRNISPVVVLFIIITLSFLLYLLTGRNIHHHHWDYFNPPGNDGRLS